MREELAKRVGRRGRFTATFKRTGIRKSQYGVSVTVLLVDLRDEAETQVTDHLWLIEGKQIADLNLQPGERISFVATVAAYYKRPPRDAQDFSKWDRDDIGVFEKDYKLVYPTAIARVMGEQRALPLFAEEHV